jgi:hypothetical protein
MTFHACGYAFQTQLYILTGWMGLSVQQLQCPNKLGGREGSVGDFYVVFCEILHVIRIMKEKNIL